MQDRKEARNIAIQQLEDMVRAGPEHIRCLLDVPTRATQVAPLANVTNTFTSRRATSFNFMDIEVLPTLSKSQKTTKSPFHQEIDQWSVEPPKSGDPVTLWRTFAPDYPALFYCFQKIFSISASSIPVESVFSEASFQVTDLRNRMAPEKVNTMMVISEFYSER